MAKNPNYVPELTLGDKKRIEAVRDLLATVIEAKKRNAQLFALVEAQEKLTYLIGNFVLQDVDMER